jgi:uncharacterized spore protein YtfJ
MDEATNRLLSATAKELETILTSKTVVGSPIQLGDCTIVPLVSVGFGVGIGAGSGSDKKNGSGGGSGSAFGGGVKPVALLISDKNGVRVETVLGSAASAAETIADTIGKVMSAKGKADAAAE